MVRVTVEGKGNIPNDPLANMANTYRALYEYILRLAQKEGVKEDREGVTGFLWEGSMRDVVNTLYPGRDDLEMITKRLANHRKSTANVLVAVRGSYGKGVRKHGIWWVRHEWSDTRVLTPSQKPGKNLARKQASNEVQTRESTRQELAQLPKRVPAPVPHPTERENESLREDIRGLEFARDKLKASVRELANENARLRERILTLEKVEVANRHLRKVIERFVTVADTTTLLDIIVGEIPDE